MSEDPPGPGEDIPPPRNEEGTSVLFYDRAISEDKLRGRLIFVDHDTEDQLATIFLYDSELEETLVPFAWPPHDPDRGYVLDTEIHEGGEL